ncbi:MAG: penicillin-binding protein 2 [Alphaproteobacteria bacterium]|nr:penicillin-binding protein 2 [Alphaproteobacteria bacterium]MBV9372431.1 penicillin-binding protein 2 [Alphaproteobacteria bacterium]MBV9899491.1 penicillin-binding protein 2 [Alphaproteobacteria bacterium]
MKRRNRPVITESNQAFTFTRRAMVLGGGQGLVAAALGGRMAWLAIAENEHYKTLSESNRVQMRLIPPRRGWIVDRHGHPIAINRSDFRVDLIPDRLKEPDRVIAELARLLDLPADEVERIREELSRAAGYQPVPVAENLPFEKYAAVTVRLPELPGVSPLRSFSRFYPEGAAVAHLTGYVGTPSREDYVAEEKNPLLITPGFKVGKDDLEKTMEPRLRGRPGAQRIEVTAHGKLVRELETVQDRSGSPLPLTIDIGLHSYAARRIGPESGCAVVIDCLTGDILATPSMPAYDPNSFSDGISHKEWEMMAQDERHPLINKVMQGLYPPGSTCKPMMAVALQKAGISPNERVNCQKAWRLGNAVFHCSGGPHGPIAMHQAISKSCDIYFYQMALKAGVKAISPVAKQFGMGEKFDLPLPSQRYGTWPDPDWLQRRFKRDWQSYDTVNMSIGQGYVLVNPLQQAVMVARLLTGRKVMPRILAGGPAPRFEEIAGIDPEHLAFVRAGMSDVVNGGGTASRFKLPVPELMGGKTGTAQVRRISLSERAGGVRTNASLGWRMRDHSWFVCFAPVQAPRYAACFFVEHGGFGAAAAAPIAKDVMTYLFNRDLAMQSLAAMEEQWGGGIAERMKQKADSWRPSPPPAEAGSRPDDKGRPPRVPPTGTT